MPNNFRKNGFFNTSYSPLTTIVTPYMSIRATPATNIEPPNTITVNFANFSSMFLRYNVELRGGATQWLSPA